MQPEGLLSQLGFYLTIMVCAVAVCATVVGGIAFWKTDKGAAKTFSLLIERANALQMAAVVLIVMGGCSLRIMNLISADATVSILSGIAGYVLGGVSRKTSSKSDEEPDSN